MVGERKERKPKYGWWLSYWVRDLRWPCHNVASKYVNSNRNLPDYSHLAQDGLELMLPEGESLVQDYATSNTYSVLVGMDNKGLETWKESYATDQFYSKVLNAFQINNDKDGN